MGDGLDPNKAIGMCEWSICGDNNNNNNNNNDNNNNNKTFIQRPTTSRSQTITNTGSKFKQICLETFLKHH